MLNNIFGILNSKLFICLRLSLLNYAFFPVQTLLTNNATQEKIIKLVKIFFVFASSGDWKKELITDMKNEFVNSHF